MPSKFKKAIAVVKDQTSISLAKVGGADSSSLEVAILKATTHEEVPIDERYVTEVLQHVSSNKTYARSCARALGRRIGRTRNWVVAVKSLMLVLRIFQDGDPYFPKEVLHAMKRGYKILNLTSFRDESTTSCPWDFSDFVRTFALYLDERLDCFLTGKLQRRTSHHQPEKTRGYSRKNMPSVRDMKPGVLLDRISHWQKLLDRAISSQPTGAAKTNRLVQTCLYAIVQETFELYRDVSDGLALLLDGFFHLQYNNCVSAYQTCVKASKQFEALRSFHDLCKTIGVGRTSEYPSVQKLSDELVETLQEFLKDQSSFPGENGRTQGISTNLPPISPKVYSESRSFRQSDIGSRDRSMSEFGGSQCTSLEDLISADPGFSPDRYSDPGRENPPQSEEFLDENDSASVRSDPTDHRGISSVLDLLSLDGPSTPPEFQETGFELDKDVSTSLPKQEGWELVLFDTSTQPTSETGNHNYDTVTNNNNAFGLDFFSSFDAWGADIGTSNSPLQLENSSTNPFLEDTISDLNGISRANPPIQGDLFKHFTQTGFDTSFPESGFPGDLGAVVGSTTPPSFQAEFTDSSFNEFDSFSSGFPTNLGNVPSTFEADFGDDPGEIKTNNIAPSVSLTIDTHDNNSSHQSLPVDLFGEFGNAFDQTSTFSADLKDGIADAMNQIVPFNAPSSDDFFSSGPGFQAAPTFCANSMDTHLDNDPFASLTDMTAVEKQQQFWLQNQNKILARHLT